MTEEDRDRESETETEYIEVVEVLKKVKECVNDTLYSLMLRDDDVQQPRHEIDNVKDTDFVLPSI